ncbi:Kcnh5 [Symbiodinium pilosum]|uniref:Kcnh5 protein n=1 Tax=Symbiodinium pilosum TaxID=2952 RepID=A0A812VER1_SYMPI|nr:Kcnh5 [Symbiodinium pilosum]
MEVMAWVSSCYWLLDIPLSFLVGYPLLEEGTVEMRVPKIAVQYLRSWFIFDIAVVCLDWALHIWSFMYAANSDSGADAGVAFFRTAKTIRLLRFFRLIRLMKARGRINDFVERVQSEASLILIGIAKLVAFIILVNHLVACVWYAIGSYDLTREDRWLRASGLEARNIWYRYSTALHWSITQFTPASMEVVPANEYERFFTVCMILSGMLIFSSFVSAITNAMNQLRNLNSWRHEQESLLRRYLQENSVTPSLTARIHNCLQKALQQSRRRVHVDEIRILQQLPLSLKFELTNEIYAPALGKHPFFTFCHSCLPSESRKIYSNGVSQKYLVISQELLTTGETGKHMFFLTSGTLVYTREEEPEQQAVTTTQPWLVEAALWLKWLHVGTASSTTHCELLGLDASKVQDVLKDEATVRAYARKFWKHFSENPKLLSDIWIDEEAVYHWAASAMSRAEEILGHSIQPEPLSPNFTRFLNRFRRLSTGMLRRFSVASMDPDDAGHGPGKLPPQLQAFF